MLRTASLGSNFTDSYKKKSVLKKTSWAKQVTFVRDNFYRISKVPKILRVLRIFSSSNY